MKLLLFRMGLLLFLSMECVGTASGADTACPALFQQAATLGKDFRDEPSLVVCYLASLASQESRLPNSIIVAYQDQHSPRTDQQTGASNSSAGTTITEKTGISDLLNLAVERGAITRSASASAVTLQTTPYLFFTGFGGADSPDNWRKLALLRHLSVTATFKTDAANTSSGLGDFEEAEAKWLAIGSRSNRDVPLDNELVTAVARALPSLTDATGCTERFIATKVQYRDARTKLRQSLDAMDVPSLDKLLSILTDATQDLRANLSPQERIQLQACGTKINTEAVLSSEVGRTISTRTAEWEAMKDPTQLALSYAYVRDSVIDDYSRVKLLFSYDSPGVVTVNLNADVSLNSSSSSTAGVDLERLRSYSVEAGLTLGRFANSTVDLTFAAKYQRDRAQSLDKKYWQAKANLYLTKGLTIPLAVTYTNHTDDTGQSQTRFSLGLSLTADAFLGVANRFAF